LALLYEDRERVDLGVYVYFKSLIDFTEAELLSFCIFSFIFILGFYFILFFGFCLVISLFSLPALCLQSSVIISYRGSNVVLAFGRCLPSRQILPGETCNNVCT
jgi:hypothetical protein